MKKLKLKEALNIYLFVCKEYVRIFAKKQGLEFNQWDIHDPSTEIVIFNDYRFVFHLSDIILDLNSKTKKGLILNWYDDEQEFNSYKSKQEVISYRQYISGLRFGNTHIFDDAKEISKRMIKENRNYKS